MKQTFVLSHPTARQRAQQAVREAAEGFVVTVGEPTRTLEQNAAQWPILDAFSKQAQLVVSGKLEYVSAEEWKDVLTASFRDELQRVAHFGGRMILLGQRTSKFPKGEFSAWLDFLNAAAVEHGVDVGLTDESESGAVSSETT